MCAPNIEAGHLSCLDMLTTFTSAARIGDGVSHRHRTHQPGLASDALR